LKNIHCRYAGTILLGVGLVMVLSLSTSAAPPELAPADKVAPIAAPVPAGDSLNEQQNILEGLSKKVPPPTLQQLGVPTDRNPGSTPKTAPYLLRHRGTPRIIPTSPTKSSSSVANFASIAAAVEVAGEPLIVLPEIPTAVRLSQSDINRIVCQNGDIQDIVFSKEKGLTVSAAGRDAYLKYARGPQEAHPPSELFIVC